MIPQRNYAGRVQGEVVIQGDLHAQGDINIIANGASNMGRQLWESPDIFGPMQVKVQTVIRNLLDASTITNQYVDENRLDEDSRRKLTELSKQCGTSLEQLENLKNEIERWNTQKVQQEQIQGVIEDLQSQIGLLEDINGTIRKSVIQLEKALRKYIREVKDGQRASSIRTRGQSISTLPMDQHQWRLVQELEGVGITAVQFQANRDKILKMLVDAFGEDINENATATRFGSRFSQWSPFTNRNKDLITAVKQENLDKAKEALQRGADVNTKNRGGRTALCLAVQKSNFDITQLLLTYKADKNKDIKEGDETPLWIAASAGYQDIVKILLKNGVNIES